MRDAQQMRALMPESVVNHILTEFEKRAAEAHHNITPPESKG